MAQLYRNGKLSTVKNLGWLLRNWRLVKAFYVHDRPDGKAWMIASLGNNDHYATMWACRTICRDWLNRPVFRGLPVQFLQENTTCGAIKYRESWEA